MNGKQFLAAMEAVAREVQGKDYRSETGFLATVYHPGAFTYCRDGDVIAADALQELTQFFGSLDQRPRITADVVSKARQDLGLVAYRQPTRRTASPAPPPAAGDEGRTLFDGEPSPHPLPDRPLPGNGNGGNGKGPEALTVTPALIAQVLAELAARNVKVIAHSAG